MTNTTTKTALYTYLALDPRKGTEQMPAPATTLGIEVTSRTLADACGLGSVDEHHGFHRAPAGATWPAIGGRPGGRRATAAGCRRRPSWACW